MNESAAPWWCWHTQTTHTHTQARPLERAQCVDLMDRRASGRDKNGNKAIHRSILFSSSLETWAELYVVVVVNVFIWNRWKRVSKTSFFVSSKMCIFWQQIELKFCRRFAWRWRCRWRRWRPLKTFARSIKTFRTTRKSISASFKIVHYVQNDVSIDVKTVLLSDVRCSKVLRRQFQMATNE